jgi:hypothetical protein
MSEKILSSEELLNIIHSGKEITNLMFAKKVPGRPSGPILVLVESLSRLDSISETEK